jgi:hypothetical protein
MMKPTEGKQTTMTTPPVTETGDDFFAVTVTFKMTQGQRRAYAREYGLASGPGLANEVAAATAVVPGDVREDLAERVRALIGQDYRLNEFTTYSVGQPV